MICSCVGVCVCVCEWVCECAFLWVHVWVPVCIHVFVHVCGGRESNLCIVPQDPCALLIETRSLIGLGLVDEPQASTCPHLFLIIRRCHYTQLFLWVSVSYLPRPFHNFCD